MHKRLFAGAVIVTVFAVTFSFSTDQNATAKSPEVESFSDLRALLKDIKTPKIEQPKWLKEQIAAEEAALEAARAAGARTNLSGRIVTYSVIQKGVTSSDFAAFQANANATMNDSRGWARLGLSFRQVASGGEFILVLSQASLVPSFSSGCSADWSCRVGQYVIINQDRWNGATAAWNSAGGGLRDYQHMVINHELGHWLGHDHLSCSGSGNLAPVMLQQSIDLQGCKFNPWPLASELWTTR